MKSTGLNLPADVLLQHQAILGKTGAGKTNTAKVLIEYLLDRGERVCVIDPTGVAWGLRLRRDGKTPAYPVVIFGGRHGDMPIAEGHGAALAEIIGGSASPCIIDTKKMTVGERTRFFTTFAEGLLIHNRAPLHLVIDEAHLFAPQGRVADPASGKMLHATNNLVSLGRGGKIAVTLISQRPAKLHKDSLSQAETLIAMKLIAPQDRAAIMDWIHDQADPAEGKALVASLPTLKKGDAWVWYPEGGLLERRHFPLCSTFDSSRGLESDEQAGALPAIDIAAIESKLEVVAAEAVANDPQRLKKRVAQLEAELAQTRAELEAVPAAGEIEPGGFDQAALEEAFANGHAEGAAAARKEIAEDVVNNIDSVFAPLRSLRMAMDRHAKGLFSSPSAPVADLPVMNSRPHEHHRTEESSPAPRPQASAHLGPHKAAGAELRILKVLAQTHPARFTKSQWATLAGMKKIGGTWGTYVSRLRTAGYIDERDDGLIGVTPAGLKACGALPPVARTPAERINMWQQRIGSGPSRMLDVLLKHHPTPVRRQVLAAHLRMVDTGGTFGTYLSRLRSNGLIVTKGSEIRVADILLRA